MPHALPPPRRAALPCRVFPAAVEPVSPPGDLFSPLSSQSRLPPTVPGQLQERDAGQHGHHVWRVPRVPGRRAGEGRVLNFFSVIFFFLWIANDDCLVSTCQSGGHTQLRLNCPPPAPRRLTSLWRGACPPRSTRWRAWWPPTGAPCLPFVLFGWGLQTPQTQTPKCGGRHAECTSTSLAKPRRPCHVVCLPRFPRVAPHAMPSPSPPLLPPPNPRLQAGRQDSAIPGGHQAGGPAAQPRAEAQQGGGYRVRLAARPLQAAGSQAEGSGQPGRGGQPGGPRASPGQPGTGRSWWRTTPLALPLLWPRSSFSQWQAAASNFRLPAKLLSLSWHGACKCVHCVPAKEWDWEGADGREVQAGCKQGVRVKWQGQGRWREESKVE